MKKFKVIALALIAVIVCFSATLTACNTTNDGLEYEINEEGNVEITSYTDSSTRSEVTIPDEIDGHPVTSINNFSIFNTEDIEVLYIGKNIKEIGDWALTNNKCLKAYVVDAENPYFTSVDGVLFTKDMETLVMYPTARNITFDQFGQTTDTTTYTIPEGVKHIANRAFYRCVYLDGITLPSTLESIGNMSFHRCSAVPYFALPEGLKSIGRDAFTYCTGMTEIDIPSTVTFIDEYAYSYCENVRTVRLYCKQSDVTLGSKWYPTQDGKDIKTMETIWVNG